MKRIMTMLLAVIMLFCGLQIAAAEEGQTAEESVDCFAEGQIIHTAVQIIRGRDTLLHLSAQFDYIGAPLQAAAVSAAIQGNVPGDPGKKSVQIAPRFMGWDAVPRFQISIIFAFFRCFPIQNDPLRQCAQMAAVFCGRLSDCLFIP